MKIAILGASPSKWLAPFSNPSWKIWKCSPSTVDVPRFDFHFEIHAPELVATDDESYKDYLRVVPAYMQEQTEEYPFSKRYPKEEMLSEFGTHFFTSSIAWMLALAITDKPDEIGLWGIDMMADEEYAHQRQGCFRFMEIAKDRGINITLPDGCGLLMPSKLYGYE